MVYKQKLRWTNLLHIHLHSIVTRHVFMFTLLHCQNRNRPGFHFNQIAPFGTVHIRSHRLNPHIMRLVTLILTTGEHLYLAFLGPSDVDRDALQN